MRVLAGTSNGRGTMREKLTLANGIPVTIALEYASGKRVPSRIPGAPDQIYYTLTDGRGFYADLEVAELIEKMDLRSREPFTVCKNGRDWEVTRAEEKGARPTESSAPAGVGGTPAHTARSTSEPTPEPSTKLEYALKTAIAAACAAEKYATEIGYTVRFDADAIKSMAITVLINMDGGRK